MDTKKPEIVKKREHEYCKHSSLVKEFAYGAPTGNFICAQCGRLLSSIIRGDGR